MRHRPAAYESSVTITDCDAESGSCRIDLSALHLGENPETISFQLTKTGNAIHCAHKTFGHDNSGSWHGMRSGGGTANLLTMAEGTKGETFLHGSVVDAANDLVCQLFPNAEGINRAVCIPGSEFPPELDSIEEEDDVTTTTSSSGDGSRFLQQQQQQQQQLAFASSDPKKDLALGRRDLMNERCAGRFDILNVLVIWTAKAECRNSELAAGCTLTAATERDMRGLIGLAIAETNTAFQSSGVTTAPLDDVHAKRAQVCRNYPCERDPVVFSLHHFMILQFGADLVAMLIDDEAACGIGFRGPQIDKMFSVTYWYCVKGRFSFAHEVGHNW